MERKSASLSHWDLYVYMYVHCRGQQCADECTASCNEPQPLSGRHSHAAIVTTSNGTDRSRRRRIRSGEPYVHMHYRIPYMHCVLVQLLLAAIGAVPVWFPVKDACCRALAHLSLQSAIGTTARAGGTISTDEPSKQFHARSAARISQWPRRAAFVAARSGAIAACVWPVLTIIILNTLSIILKLTKY